MPVPDDVKDLPESREDSGFGLTGTNESKRSRKKRIEGIDEGIFRMFLLF